MTVRQCIILSFLATVLSITSRAYSQTDDPPPSLCDTPPCGGVVAWTDAPQPFIGKVPINGCESQGTCCILTATYRYRKVCKTANDPGIFQIEITGLSWDKECSPNGFDPVPLLRTAIYGILARNDMGFPPNLNDDKDQTQCMTNYTVQAAACWINDPQYPAAITCNSNQGSACCKGGYQVCRAIDPVTGQQYRKVTWLGQQMQFNNCLPPCMPSCGAFQDDGIFTRKKEGQPAISMAPPPSTGDTVTIAPATIETRIHEAHQR